MNCPMYIGSDRECKKQLPFKLPNWINTFKYCLTEKYKECPFFIGINKIGDICEHFLNCQECKECKVHACEGFDKIAKKYCFSKDNVNCSRYKLKEAGLRVPSNLLPDASIL